MKSDGVEECLDEARARTGMPYTNVLAVDNTTRREGFASAGLIYSLDANNLNPFVLPPSQTRRGAWVGGGSVTANQMPSPSVATHEIGHTLHWPHSYIGPTQFDNPADLMSGTPEGGWCSKFAGGGSTQWPCISQNTLAFNRFAAGWIDDDQVQVHVSGSNNFALAAPTSTSVQMVGAPNSADGRVMLTLEARSLTGFDRFLGAEGVAVHIIDQRNTACASGIAGNKPCVSTSRRQYQARSSPGSTGHIITVGTSRTINGVTISVTGQRGNSFTVTVSGSFTAPSA